MFGHKKNQPGTVRRFVHSAWVQWCINSCQRAGVACTFKRSEVSGTYITSPLIKVDEEK